jgi:hypothetical protein
VQFSDAPPSSNPRAWPVVPSFTVTFIRFSEVPVCSRGPISGRRQTREGEGYSCRIHLCNPDLLSQPHTREYGRARPPGQPAVHPLRLRGQELQGGGYRKEDAGGLPSVRPANQPPGPTIHFLLSRLSEPRSAISFHAVYILCDLHTFKLFDP